MLSTLSPWRMSVSPALMRGLICGNQLSMERSDGWTVWSLRTRAETESAGRDSPEKDEVEDQHGIEIVEITVDAEQHVADESEDA